MNKAPFLLRLVVGSALTAMFLAAPGFAAQAPTGGAPQISEAMRALMQERQENQEDLVWLVQGLRDMDKNKALRLTKDQAKKLLVIYEKWIKNGTIREEMPARRQPNANGQQGQNRQQNAQDQRQGAWNDPAQQQKLQADMKKAEDALSKDLDAAEKILVSAQVKFLDNMDFKADVYGLGGQGFGSGMRAGFAAGAGASGAAGGQRTWAQGSGAYGQNRANSAQFQKMRQEAQKKQELLVKLYKDVHNLLKTRSK